MKKGDYALVSIIKQLHTCFFGVISMRHILQLTESFDWTRGIP